MNVQKPKDTNKHEHYIEHLVYIFVRDTSWGDFFSPHELLEEISSPSANFLRRRRFFSPRRENKRLL
ncbi:hypothetical protein BHE74_00006604, partial [Ensete ventricosum]